jgi:hypothetical protein
MCSTANSTATINMAATRSKVIPIRNQLAGISGSESIPCGTKWPAPAAAPSAPITAAVAMSSKKAGPRPSRTTASTIAAAIAAAEPIEKPERTSAGSPAV